MNWRQWHPLITPVATLVAIMLLAAGVTALYWLANPPSATRSNPGHSQAAAMSLPDYLATFGRADPTDTPHLERTQRIFARLLPIAGESRLLTPELVVLDTRRFAFAVSLPDGKILLSRRTLRLCYQGVDPAVGDGRIAFLLGHELAHQTKHDLRAMRLGFFDAPEPHQTEPNRAVQQQWEREADQLGFLYAGIAGFRVRHIIDDPDDGGFFRYWRRANRHDPNSTHPRDQQRLAALERQMNGIESRLPLFRFGVRLLHFGEYRNAIRLFDAFRQHFPGTVVLNNLGFAELQLARQALAPRRIERFWYPGLIDPTSRAALLVKRAGTSTVPNPEQARYRLRRAEQYLRQAMADDPDYRPARINLVIHHLLNQDPLAARMLASAATDDWRLEMLGLIAEFQERPDPAQLTRLEALVERYPDSLDGRYNLAQFHQEFDQTEQALQIRRELATQPLPPRYREAICRDPAIDCADPASPTTVETWDESPIRPGDDLVYPNAEVQAMLASADRIEIDDGEAEMRIYRLTDGSEILERDGFAELVALPAKRLADPDGLIERLGEPHLSQILALGEVWQYPGGLALWREPGRIREIWLGPD